jgi:hypothetical protein
MKDHFDRVESLVDISNRKRQDDWRAVCHHLHAVTGIAGNPTGNRGRNAGGERGYRPPKQVSQLRGCPSLSDCVAGLLTLAQRDSTGRTTWRRCALLAST